MSNTNTNTSNSNHIDIVKRSCPTCEASCGLVLEVDRDENRVLSIKGNPDDPRSKGYVCAKSQAFNYVYEDPDRLRAPVKKIKDGWQEISWEEALSLAGKGLRDIREQYGKDSLAIYYGEPNGHNAGTNLYTQMLMETINTERFFAPANLDQLPQEVALHLLIGDGWHYPVPDIDRTDLFICMGGNPVVSQGSLMGAPDVKSRLKSLNKNGGYSVVIDPRRTETAQACDQHLFITPGTDAYFLLAFLHEVFTQGWQKLGHLSEHIDGLDDLRELAANYSPELVADITGISPKDLRDLVKRYCSTEKAVIYSRIGLCTQKFGTLASWLVYAVNIVTGHFDREGCMMFSRPASGQFEPTDEVTPLLRGRFHARSTGFPEVRGLLPASHLGKELAYQGDEEGNDRIRGMLTLAGNPVISVPNGKLIREGLQNVDFYVAIDIYINETTSQADVILPPIHQLEHTNYDLLWSTFSSTNFAAFSPQVLKPDANGLQQWEIMLQLLGEMLGTPWQVLDDLMADGMASQVAAGLQKNYPDISTEEIKMAMGEERRYERYLDTMLRAGPYGDKFGRETGIDLQQIIDAGGIMTFGPLKPQMPEFLRTENKRIRLVHDCFLEDIPRLNQGLTEGLYAKGKFLLIGRRQIRDMNSWLHNIHAYIKGKNRCTLLMHPEDAKHVGVNCGKQVTIRSRMGEVVAEVTVSDEMMRGVVSLPHGWGHIYSDSQQALATGRYPGSSCNDLVDDDQLDMPSGTSVVNGVEVELSALA